jgi:hypothetical protein
MMGDMRQQSTGLISLVVTILATTVAARVRVPPLFATIVSSAVFALARTVTPVRHRSRVPQSP